MSKKIIVMFFIIVAVLLAAIIIWRFFFVLPPEETETQIANPASVHCEEIGGLLEIREDADGGQVGFCTLPDGSVCEEWALLRGECDDTVQSPAVEETATGTSASI